MARARQVLVDGEPFEVWARPAGWPDQEVAGESHYVDALRALVGSVPADGTELWTTAELRPDPDNRHDPHAVAVLCGGRTVGFLPRADAGRYAGPLAALVAAGWSPTARARVWVGQRETWNERRNRYDSAVVGSVQLCLPEPHLLAPVTRPPDQPHVLLPWGATIQVTGEEKHLAVLVARLPAAGECWVHVTLHELVETGPRSTRTVVEVRLDGERVGQLTPKMSGELLPAVQHLAGRGAVTVARALVKGNRLKADVVLHCQRAGELPDEWFAEPVRHATGAHTPDPVRAEPVRAEPVRAEPVRAEPVRAEPVRAEPVRAEQVHAEPAPAAVLPPAGWYADPTVPAQWRWWDGALWTTHVAPR